MEPVLEFHAGDGRVRMTSLLLCAVEKVLSALYVDSVKAVNDQRRDHGRDGFRRSCVQTVLSKFTVDKN